MKTIDSRLSNNANRNDYSSCEYYSINIMKFLKSIYELENIVRKSSDKIILFLLTEFSSGLRALVYQKRKFNLGNHLLIELIN